MLLFDNLCLVRSTGTDMLIENLCLTRTIHRCWRQYISGSVKDKASVMNGGQHGYTVKVIVSILNNFILLSVSLLKESLFQTLLQSTAEWKQPKTRRIKHEKEWLFVKPPPPSFKWGQKHGILTEACRGKRGLGWVGSTQLQWIVKWRSVIPPLHKSHYKWGYLTISRWLMQNIFQTLTESQKVIALPIKPE